MILSIAMFPFLTFDFDPLSICSVRFGSHFQWFFFYFISKIKYENEKIGEGFSCTLPETKV